MEAFVGYQVEPDWSVVEYERQEISSLKQDQTNHEVRRLMGKRVTVTGKLFHAITGHHRTKVLIEVVNVG
jgi:Domain of unknown function (DUF4431)